MQLSGAADSHHALDLSSCSAALQTTAILQGNPKRLGECIDSDVIVEPVRAPFIPGFAAVKAAAKKAGRFPRDQGWSQPPQAPLPQNRSTLHSPGKPA